MFLATAGILEPILGFLTALMPMLAGPGAAVIALFLIVLFFFFIVYKKIIPFVTGLLDDHRKDLRLIMNEHAQDRVAFTEGMKNLANGMIKIEYRMGSVEKALEGMTSELDDLRRPNKK